ncbi:galacturonosyltransferase 14 [Canna indica]|uniref:Hexosyltransferase n=1 Tax=Canna indica TaxID=4628 RepID=A0AAQ3K2A7_9LILI|nr:galacturonosyltransferase 14 [Canna indica]
MQIGLSPSMRSITISSTHGLLDLMKLKGIARHISFRTVFHTVLVLAFLLPFVFILTAVVTLEGVNKCSSFDCLGRRIAPSFLGKGSGGDSEKLVKDLYEILDQINSEEIPVGPKLPESFSEFISDMKNNQYDAKTFAIRLKATMENMDRELFPNLNKVVFLDDDVVVQRDLSPLWEINLSGKVNGAVETCRDLKLWKLGTLPPALIAFRGHVHPIDPSWHMLGLGYQEMTDLHSARKAAVIHYNGQCKPWLEIAYKHLQPFWTKHVNYSNDFIRNCHILEPQLLPENLAV